MKTKIKRTLSMVLAAMMVLSVVIVPAFAVDLTLQFEGATVTKSDSDQTVDLTLKASGPVDWCSVGLTTSTSAGISITDIKNYNGASIYVADYNNATGELAHMPNNSLDINSENLITFTVTIPGGTAAGNYTVTLSEVIVMFDDSNDIYDNAETISATITVNEPAVGPTQPEWELYYKLDGTTDTDTDKYIEYNPGDTVTATVYMKAKAADTLQAVDFYVTNDANLINPVVTSAIGAVRVESGDNASTATSQHVQVIGSSKTNPINVAMAADAEVAIATITFEVADTAVYNTEMPITIENTANFAVANNPTSFTPDIQSYSSDTLGVETLKTYTVTYNENKPAAASALTVTGMPDPLAVEKGHNADLAVAAAPSLANYTFGGWNTAADGTGDPYAAGGSYTANADATLYAQWTPVKYTVTFVDEDGTTVLKAATEYDYGTAAADIEMPADPSKPATQQYTYVFSGWSPAVGPVTGNATYTATYSSTVNKYTVTFYDEDGITVLKAATDYDYGTPADDIVKPADPTKPADETYTYSFAGWTPALAEVTDFADYTATYTPTYIDYALTYALGDHAADGQTAPTTPASGHYNQTVQLPAAPTAADGYTFAGWSDGANTYAAGADYVVLGTTTLTATYTENHYNVVYDANGGTGTLPENHLNVAYTASISIGSGDGLTNNGYTFVGWNTADDGSGTDYSAGASVSKLSATDGATVTLYAQWTEADYTIAYDYDDATTVPANPTSYDVSDLPITLTRPGKTGYNFDSWTVAVKSGETGAVDVDGDQIKAGTWGNLTVKANWTPAEVHYTVEHYQQNLDNDNYTRVDADTQDLTGLTGDPTAAAANTYEGFTAQAFSQETIAADSSTVVKIYYTRNVHSVTYEYEAPVPAGAPAVPAAADYKYGATVNVDQTDVSLAHYDFSGWKKDGAAAPASFVMGDADVVISGKFTEHEYTIKFWNLEDGEAGNTVLSEQTYTESTQGAITVPGVPAKTWYDPDGWTAYTLFSAQEINVYPQYVKHVYTITFKDENGDNLVDQGADNEFDIDDKGITPPAVPDKPGYTGAWPAFPTDTAADASVQPVYTPIGYTITFETDGGTAIAAMDYNIESTDTLPSADGKANFSFVNWKVTTADGNWAADSLINGGTAVTGKYGNVTLTAQWTQSLSYEVQEYKYAPAGYKLLIIDAAGAGAGNVYTYDGATMYYTEDASYQIGGSAGVFYTLVAVDALALTDEQVGKINSAAGTAAAITYDGDINGDGTVNIADANAVFQMVVATGSYYGIDQLSIAQRLAADMVKATDNAELRGSIEDVNAIVNIINGVH